MEIRCGDGGGMQSGREGEDWLSWILSVPYVLMIAASMKQRTAARCALEMLSWNVVWARGTLAG